MKHTIEIFSDELDDVIHKELVQLLDDYKYYLNEARRDSPKGVHSFNKALEIEELTKDIKALKRVVKIWAE
tara:strand:- start:844 stop:1056 length:213 start_codon:yes stop_codon:yes gene_type:complete